MARRMRDVVCGLLLEKMASTAVLSLLTGGAQGKIIEVHIGTLLADQAFTFTDWTAEMKAKASICISDDDTLIQSLEIAKSRIQIMIDKGKNNDRQVLQGLIDRADRRIEEIRSGEKPALLASTWAGSIQ